MNRWWRLEVVNVCVWVDFSEMGSELMTAVLSFNKSQSNYFCN
jgi:hypothetical protein